MNEEVVENLERTEEIWLVRATRASIFSRILEQTLS